MKRTIFIAAAFVVLTVASVSATAQTSPTGPRPAAPKPTPVAATPVPETRIGLVDTTQFGDEKAGITRYVNAVKGVQTAFQARVNELNTLQTQVKAISDEITKLSANPAASAEMIKAKQDEGERLQRDWKYKKDQFDVDFEKRLTEVVAPVSTDIGKGLDQYAAQHGLTLILDISKLLPAILTVNPALDITQAFIADYNSKHP